MKLLVLFLMLMPAPGGDDKSRSAGPYRVVEVARFGAGEGVVLPANYTVTLTLDVIERLNKLPVLVVAGEREGTTRVRRCG